MDATEKAITLFSTRVRQLILQFEELRTENHKLADAVAERDGMIALLKDELAQKQEDYNRLMVAKMVEITDGDMEAAKKRLAKLIRNVDKCITLISEN